MSFNLDKNIIESISKVANRYEINKVTLFGSRARGDNKKTSDIDLAVYCNEGFDNQSELYFELEDIDTLLKLDIVFINSNTDKKLIENIKREGVIIYERK
ncbi:nucleotidyltransferase domain-containing protein [Clostridium sp. MSJ-11]|uniref:Nucleotidyltransferase domain-containing protein n=1 Tax=Clostridium mobile TaxID=2841512 RepID=A0ABS6EI61_9CLOT|nr:nucleotidyltransferase domain-containing protein [Clostridium mobile]MBU5484089.1 nucleotidyltransferase domain-containing protein [Clostridium mobile]